MFSSTFRYALISLLELAGRDEWTQASVIASRHQLSQPYLSVVLGDLRRLGLIQSQQGKKGGYRLLRDPGEVNLLDLYLSLAGSGLTERPLSALVSTGEGDGSAPANGAAGSADAWLAGLCQRWSSELASTSLADLQRWAAQAQRRSR